MVQAWTSLYMDGTLVFDLPIYMKPKFGHRWYISLYTKVVPEGWAVILSRLTLLL